MDRRMTNSVAQAVGKRDRNIVLTGLAAVIFTAAIYTVFMAGQFNKPMDVALMPSTHSDMVGARGFLMLFIMWAVMQVAMMSPTAVPMILMHGKIERHRQPGKVPFFRIALFFFGYVILWALFSAVFAVLQIGLRSAALLSPTMGSASPLLSGGILIAAGLFQFSHLKQACLKQCRSPVTYLMTEWRNGRVGALFMGLKHGAHCVGCCWVIMALLFVAGVMNLFWMAAITTFVLIEKLAARGEYFGRIVGVGLIIWGTLIII
jgi:predicted metal-binding membrane protein